MSTKHQHRKSTFKILSAGFASVLLATGSLAGNSYAEGSSSYFDANAKACVIENYNSETGATVTDIEDVDFNSITALSCPNRNIVNLRGLVLMPNLESLDISFNNDLYSLDFSQNTKLESINVKGMATSYFDFKNNPDLETIVTDRTLSLTTPAYAKKTNSGYAIDLSSLKFLDSSSARVVNFQSSSDVPYAVEAIANDGYVLQISTRGGFLNYAIYFNGNTEAATHSPIYVNHNCKTTSDGYSCNNSVFYGDTIDTDAIVDNTLSKIFNLASYKLSKVEIVPPTANVELTTNTDTLKKGKVLTDANFTLQFHFDVDSGNSSNSGASTAPTTPDTGAFTSDNQGAVLITTTAIVATLAIIAYLAKYFKSRFTNRIDFSQK